MEIWECLHLHLILKTLNQQTQAFALFLIFYRAYMRVSWLKFLQLLRNQYSTPFPIENFGRNIYALWSFSGQQIEQEVNTNHRCLSPIFMFTDLSHHRTCRSAYGGFVLLHLTMCNKLFSAIPSRYVTSILLSDSVLSCEQRVPFRTSDDKRLSRQQSFTIVLHNSVLPFRQPVPWVL